MTRSHDRLGVTSGQGDGARDEVMLATFVKVTGLRKKGSTVTFVKVTLSLWGHMSHK